MGLCIYIVVWLLTALYNTIHNPKTDNCNATHNSMKKLLTIAVLILGLVACQNEEERLDVVVDGDMKVTINVEIPEDTRAGSNQGVFENNILADDNLTMRYVLQVFYRESGTPTRTERQVRFSDTESAAFEVNLAPGRNYRFVVWADVVKKEASATEFTDVDYRYNTQEFTSIMRNGCVALDETYDAFTATELIEQFNGQKSIDLHLKRPFAKLCVQTTELSIAATQPNKVVMTCEDIPVAYNAYAGKASENLADANYDYTIDTAVANTYGETKSSAEYTLFSDYLFVGSNKLDCTLVLYDGNTELKSLPIEVDVKTNYVTTVKGKLL